MPRLNVMNILPVFTAAQWTWFFTVGVTDTEGPVSVSTAAGCYLLLFGVLVTSAIAAYDFAFNSVRTLMISGLTWLVLALGIGSALPLWVGTTLDPVNVVTYVFMCSAAVLYSIVFKLLVLGARAKATT